MNEANRTSNVDLNKIPSYIDHTLLKADANTQTITKLCEEAKEYNFYSAVVCP